MNGRTFFGQVGVRDPEGPCEAFDGSGYDGRGECSELSPEATRFTDYGRDGRRDRLRPFFAAKRRERAKP